MVAPQRTVLLVSSLDARDLDAEYLRAHELRVCYASGPDEALRCLDAVEVDVALVDLPFGGSPAIDTTFLRTLRDQLDDAVSIVVVSRYMRETDRCGARSAGADCFLTRPVSPAAILNEVRRALILRRTGRRLPWTPGPHIIAALPVPGYDRRHAS